MSSSRSASPASSSGLKRASAFRNKSTPEVSPAASALERVRDRLHLFNNDQASCWNDRLVPELKLAGISVLSWKHLRKADREFAIKFFQEQVDPLLTPVTLDPSHPFPRVLNKALCLALLLRHKRKLKSGTSPKILGVITIPRSLPL